MTQKSIISRLLEGETIFVAGATADSGAGTVAHWYQKVRNRGRFLHTRRIADGVEMWADDEPSPRSRAMLAARRLRYQ